MSSGPAAHDARITAARSASGPKRARNSARRPGAIRCSADPARSGVISECPGVARRGPAWPGVIAECPGVARPGPAWPGVSCGVSCGMAKESNGRRRAERPARVALDRSGEGGALNGTAKNGMKRAQACTRVRASCPVPALPGCPWCRRWRRRVPDAPR
jgi:hypothetical protein